MHRIPQQTCVTPRRRPGMRCAALMTAPILTVGVAVAACAGGASRPGAGVTSITPGASPAAPASSGCVNTTRAPAASAGATVPLLPTTDPFYKWSGSLARDAPGTILRTRTIAFAEFRKTEARSARTQVFATGIPGPGAWVDGEAERRAA